MVIGDVGAESGGVVVFGGDGEGEWREAGMGWLVWLGL